MKRKRQQDNILTESHVKTVPEFGLPKLSNADGLDPSSDQVTVDLIQRVVEKRLQGTPGWREHGRKVHLARAQRKDFRVLINRILGNDPTLGECASRVLRLKPTLDLDTTTFEIDMVLEALRYNHRIEALYIHNFEEVCCVNCMS